MLRWNLPLVALTFGSVIVGSPDQIVLTPTAEFRPPSHWKPSHQVTSIVRTIEVAGAITREKDVVRIKPSSKTAGDWLLPIEESRATNLGFMEVVLGEGTKAEGSQRKLLSITAKGTDPVTGTHFFQIGSLPANPEETVLTVNMHFLNLTVAKPDRLGQAEGLKQGMYWEGDLLGGFASLPDAFTQDAEVKIKIKLPTPRLFDHVVPSGFNVQQASGSSMVIFTNKLHGRELITEPQLGVVHFYQPLPVMVIGNLTRLVEVSHWGNNVAVEDKFKLENRGPILEGPFSRLVHQNALYGRAPGSTSHILTALTMELPQGVRDPYYIDIIGNVSTSRFRPSSPPLSGSTQQTKLKRKEAKSSKLELSPRYPIAGGWHYQFTIGYNLEAGRWLKQKSEGQYVLKVPFFTNVVDVPLDLVTLRVRLPEGASNVEVSVPFPASEFRADLIDKTYLDTTGRPTVFIKKTKCTEKHAADIYISYSRSPIRSLQKPAAVAGWMMTIFLLAAGLMRLDWKIGY